MRTRLLTLGVVATMIGGQLAPSAAAAQAAHPGAAAAPAPSTTVAPAPPKRPSPGGAKEAKAVGPAHVLNAHATFGPPSPSAGALRGTARAAAAPQPPFAACPAIGNDTSCGVLVQVGDSGTTVLSDPSQGPYDGADDTLTGVVNTSSRTVQTIALSSNTNLFGFDGDGLCSFTFAGSAACPFGPTGYEGPKTSFSNITPDQAGGAVTFTGGLAPGATAYFSLEQPLTASAVFGGGPTPAEQGGPPNPAEHVAVCFIKQPVNCATGAFTHSFDDLKAPGRGVPLNFAPTYSSTAAAVDSPVGFGWTDTYNMSLVSDAAGNVTINQENGSALIFAPNGSGGFIAPPRVLASLALNSDGTYTFTRRADQVRHLFSAAGQLMSQTDLNGYSTVLAYTGGRLASVTDPSGRTLTFSYSGANISQVTDPMGRTASYRYDAAGNLSQTTDAAGRVWKFTYDTNHLLLTMTDPRGGTVTNTYDSSARVISQVDAAGLKTTWAYTGVAASAAGSTTVITDEHNNVTTHTYANLELISTTQASGTPAAATTTFTYDPATLGRTSITDPNGNVTTNTFDHQGNLLTSTDPAGNTTRYGYNVFDNLTSKTTPAGETTTLGFDGHDNLQGITDPTGKTTNYGYSDAGHPGDVTSMTDADGRVTSLTYDPAGNVMSVTTSPTAGVNHTSKMVYDADSEKVCQTSPNATAAGVTCGAPGSAHVANTITWTYDADREVVAATDLAGHTTTKTYDANGNVIRATDAAGNVTNATYDADNRPTKVTQGANGPAPSTTANAYDLAPGSGPCGAKVPGATFCATMTDPNGNVTVDYFSARSQPLNETRPLGHSTGHTFDLAGNETSLVDAAGRSTTSTYDVDNRVTSISYSDSATPKVSFSYDADSRRVHTIDGTGTTTYAYDADSRLTSVTSGAASTIGYAYDGANNLVTLTYPGSKAVTRAYDGAGRLTSITDPAGHATAFTYDADGNITGTAYPNGATVTSAFDATDQLISTQVAPSATPGSALATLSYARNANEQVTQENGGAALALSGSVSYSYDQKIQLTKANGTTYSYDLTGNPTGLGAAVTQTFDTADELTKSTANGATTSYSYDKLGNRTTTALPSGAARTYGYDQASRLNSVTAVMPPPVVATISPTSGPTAGGTTVTITGTAFSGATAVNFGPHPAAFTAVSDTTVTATVPAGSGTVDVTVTTPAATSAPVGADRFTYLSGPQPKVIAVLPGFGRAAGGNVVVIFGANLAHARSVQFGGRPAPFTQFPFVPDIIIARSPAGSGTVDVTVTTANGTSPKVVADHFTYLRNLGGAQVLASSGAPSEAPVNSPPAAPTSNLVASYTYDGNGLRTSKRTAAGTEPFTWDVSGRMPQLLVDASTMFIYGPDGLPVEQIDGKGTASYFFHDQLGSTRALLGPSGAVTATFTYDAYGRTTASTGTTPTPLQYASGYNDPETGFMYLRARYYDPATAQFLTPDPLVGLTNSAYGYVNNNPVNGTDPLGLCWGPECWLESGVQAVGNFANAALPVIHTVANVVAVVASACAIITSETIIGGVTCGTIALGAAAVTAGTGTILYAQGRESGLGLGLDYAGFGLAGVGSLFELGANAAEAAGAADQAISAARQAAMEAAPWYGKLGPWVSSMWWAGKAAIWGSIAQSLSDISRVLAGISLPPGICSLGTS